MRGSDSVSLESLFGTEQTHGVFVPPPSSRTLFLYNRVVAPPGSMGRSSPMENSRAGQITPSPALPVRFPPLLLRLRIDMVGEVHNMFSPTDCFALTPFIKKIFRQSPSSWVFQHTLQSPPPPLRAPLSAVISDAFDSKTVIYSP